MVLATGPGNNRQSTSSFGELTKEYDQDFVELRNRINDSMLTENLLNERGRTLVLNTIDSLKDTMHPAAYSGRKNMKVGVREILGYRLKDLNTSLILYYKKYSAKDVNDVEETSDFVKRLADSLFSFQDKWLGRYKETTEQRGLLIKIKKLVFSIFTRL